MEKQISILVVEDEAAIRDGLSDFLSFQGFRVSLAEDGLAAERAVRDHRFDLILLDLMLPHISGEQLCQQWRQAGVQTPIIMLTAKGQEGERITGLDLGADDYVTKPFSLEELLARIRAILRRLDPQRVVGQNFQVGDLHIEAAAQQATRAGCTIGLTQREVDLLCYFAAHPNRAIPRTELYEQVWHEPSTDLETRTVDMHIAKLRGKIELDPTHPELIQTVRGTGYRYEA